MKYVSLFSGIEAASVAWRPMGWEPLAFSEIEKSACQVLDVRHPGTLNHGDIEKYDWRQFRGTTDLVVGGSPCQAFSVAGLRQGLADPRGNLTLAYLAAVDAMQPEWVVWENVPGVLSHDKGQTFGTILGSLAELGYGFAYRVLDAQYVRTHRFGRAVPQRRRRVFVVGYLGDWRPAAAVLFERESLRRNPPPSRETGQDITGTLTARTGGISGKDAAAAPITASFAKHGGCAGGKDSMPHNLVAYGGNNQSGPIDVATAVNAHGEAQGRQDFESETFVAYTLRAGGFDASEDGTGRGTPLVAFSCKDYGADAGDVAPTLRAMNHAESHGNAGGQVAVAFAENQRAEIREMPVATLSTTGGGKPGQGYPAVSVALRGRDGGGTAELGGVSSNASRSSSGGGDKEHVLVESTVRRLTPLECERLQGFPDHYTAVYGDRRRSIKGDEADYLRYHGFEVEAASNGKLYTYVLADGPRYRAIGNSMAVNCMEWIGNRIEKINQLRSIAA